MKRVLSRIVSYTVAALGIGLFAYVGFNELLTIVWSSPDEPKTYRIVGADGRTMTFITLPKNEVTVAYSDPATGSVEMVLTKMRGTYGKRYFGRLWRIERLGWLGWRVYDKGVEPIDMEIEILNKFTIGAGDSSFAKMGSSSHSIILVAPDRIRFADMWLSRVENDPQQTEKMLEILKKR